MLKLNNTSQFKKDLKRCHKRGYDLTNLEPIISLLQNKKPLPKEYKDHDLTGNYKGCRECHVTSNWLLVYSTDDRQVKLIRTGTHSDLFAI